MITRAILASTLGFALLAAAPVSAQRERPADAETSEFTFQTEEEEALAEFEREMNESFALFGEIFKVEPLTEEQEARLPVAKQMTDKIMPVGSFSIVMQDSMEPMMTAIMSAVASDPRLRLSEVSGIDALDLAELDDEQAQEALDIFDPEFEARTDRLSEIVVDMVGQLFGAMEPAYRDAYARALTTRFDEGEMRELLSFFDTALGGKFAQQSFLVQYDPQMLGVMEQMGPAMIEVLPGMMEQFASLEEDFGEARGFSDLSTAERDRAAQLTGKSVSELDALEPALDTEIMEGADDGAV